MLWANNLQKIFAVQDGRSFRALDDVSFHIPRGRFFTLLGPSGCGKTTTLRSIAGLERPDSGSIKIGSATVFDSERRLFVPPNKRQIGMVFQSYAIWPHMSVFENVAFPLQVGGQRMARDRVAEKVRTALETVGLHDYERRSATKLSGGQQQRLALARALVMEPDVLLLDEPLSNLDARLRESMCVELRRLQREVGITTVYVTHDQSEALAMSDEVAVMDQGRIMQLGPPEDIYHRPNSRFVATFIGSSNIIPGAVKVAPGAGGADGVVETEVGLLRCVFAETARNASEVVVSIRPESARLADGAATEPAADGGMNLLRGRIRDRRFFGETFDYTVSVNGTELRIRGNPSQNLTPDQPVELYVREEHCLALPA